MKYSIQVLQAEVTRFENGILSFAERIVKDKVTLKGKDYPKGSKGELMLTKNIAHHKSLIAMHDKGIKELKADIKKL